MPSFVVDALSLNCFKMHLDKFWSYEDVSYKMDAMHTASRV